MPTRVLTAGLLTLLLIVAASSAHAAVYTLVAGDLDAPSEDLTADQGLAAYGTTDVLGADICVVSGITSNPGDNSLSCEDPAWGKPNAIVGVGTFILPIEPPALRIGTWRLLADGPKVNGVPTPDTLSPLFYVSPCDACDPNPAANFFTDWKASAADLSDRGQIACALMNMGSTDAQEIASDADKEIQDGTPLTVVAVGAAGGFVFAGLSEEEAGEAARLDKYVKLAHLAFCRLQKVYEDIAKDPPDPNYQSIDPPAFAHVPLVADTGVNRLMLGLDQLRAAGKAELTAVQRYEGAQQANDQDWMAQQSRAAAQQGETMAALMVNVADQIDTFVGRLSGAGLGGRAATQSDLDAMRAFAQQVHDSGFTQAQLDALATHPEVDTAYLAQQFGNAVFPDAIVGMSIDQGLQAMATGLRAQAEAQQRFAIRMEQVAPDLAPAQVTAAITTPSPYSHVAPYTERLSGATSRGGAKPVVAYHWDFGDGSTDDGMVTTHTFTIPGTYDVALTVTDGDGHQDTAHLSVTIVSRSTLNLPLCPDTGDAHCDGYDELPPGGALTVGGSGPQPVVVEHSLHLGVFHNGLSWFRVDDAQGRIDGLVPGDPAWMAAAVGRMREIFPPADPTPEQVTLDLQGGEHFAFALTSDTSLEQAVALDPRNELYALFQLPFAAANNGGSVQQLPYRRQADGAIEIGLEDLGGGGDNFTDEILLVKGAALTATGGLQVTARADHDSVAAGGDDGYVVKVLGDGEDAVLDAIGVTLPEGFSYVPGSTQGATSLDPQISGRDLTWLGRFAVPGDGAAGLHFAVRAAGSAGTYLLSATTNARGLTFTPFGPGAPVAVSAPPAQEPPPAQTSTGEQPTSPPPPPATRPQTVPIAQIVSLPSARRCLSRRHFRIHLRNNGLHPLDATVTINGRKLVVLRGKRLASNVDLRGLPKGKVVVRITIRYREGKTLTGTRTYHTCVAKRRRSGHHSV